MLDPWRKEDVSPLDDVTLLREHRNHCYDVPVLPLRWRWAGRRCSARRCSRGRRHQTAVHSLRRRSTMARRMAPTGVVHVRRCFLSPWSVHCWIFRAMPYGVGSIGPSITYFLFIAVDTVYRGSLATAILSACMRDRDQEMCSLSNPTSGCTFAISLCLFGRWEHRPSTSPRNATVVYLWPPSPSLSWCIPYPWFLFCRMAEDRL